MSHKGHLYYVSISFIGYIILYSSLYFFVSQLNCSNQTSYLLSYFFVYTFQFISTNYFFGSMRVNKNNLMRFLVFVTIMGLLQNALFYIINKLGFHYYLTTTAIIIVLYPVKSHIVMNKLYVR